MSVYLRSLLRRLAEASIRRKVEIERRRREQREREEKEEQRRINELLAAEVKKAEPENSEEKKVRSWLNYVQCILPTVL